MLTLMIKITAMINNFNYLQLTIHQGFDACACEKHGVFLSKNSKQTTPYVPIVPISGIAVDCKSNV